MAISRILTLFLLALPFSALSQNDWSVHLGKKTYVSIGHLHDYNYIPDGHLSVLPDSNDEYVMYWSEYRNSRTTGNSQYPESQKTLQPEETVFGGRVGNEGPSNGVNDGGAWLMSVHRHNGDTLIGFYHGESHWYPRNGNFTAWKSICLAYSYDNGYSWKDIGQIITSDISKPDTPTWGGAGDCCVVWDSVNTRWNCYFQEHNIRLAVSDDPLGAPGTWKKYHNGAFLEEGLGGLSSPLMNLSQTGGANPSVHWNTFYNKWVMTFHGWDGAIYTTLSSDGITWAQPKRIIPKGDYNNWYPTIIGDTDTKAGKVARIYYGEFYTSSGWRFLAARDILFDTSYYNYGYIIDPWESTNIGSYNYPGKGGIRNEVITITGTSNSLEDQNESIYFMYQNVGANGEISTRLVYQTDYNTQAISGIMLRESLNVGSKFVSIGRKSSSDTLQIIYRSEDGQSQTIQNLLLSDTWLRITNKDSTIDLMSSENGNTWTNRMTIELELTGNLFAGVFNTSHDETTFCTAKFENTVLLFDDPVGFRENDIDELAIFPNPAGDYLYFNLHNSYKDLKYNIVGLDGRMYKTGFLRVTEAMINVSELPGNQQYILQILKDSSSIIVGRFYKY
jgi:hypothetical protein